MGWLKRQKKADTGAAIPAGIPATAPAVRGGGHPFSPLHGYTPLDYTPLCTAETRLYEAIREGVPMVDAAICKTVRLAGGFHVLAGDSRAQEALDSFVEHVPVGASGMGLESFVSSYLDSLITYGNALGEIVTDGDGLICGLYHADLSPVEIRRGDTPMEVRFGVTDTGGKRREIDGQELLLFTALNPKPGEVKGVSVLRSLPFVTDILFKIYHSIGQNFDRAGNIRYAVTYRPGNDPVEKSYAKERAKLLAREWSEAMQAAKQGQVRDFVSVGDVSVRVIGADSQPLDTEVPVRQMLEQIVAKLGIPPFLLGLSWSTTERMSQQQTDILTTELEFYRRLLTPVILKICRLYLRQMGYGETLTVAWDTISLKDEIEEAHARLYLAQAKEIELRLEQSGELV